MDNLSKTERSKIMSLVRSKNTRPELVVRKYLFSLGFRYKLHRKDLPGCPDITLPKHKTVVQVHGCFWHGHRARNCRLARVPKSNIEFWQKKIDGNYLRDLRNKKALRKLGWQVIEVWECQIKENFLNAVALKINNNRPKN